MVLGRAGLRLEAQKFGVYLLIPITASLAFNEPTVQRWAADYFQFMKYPSNPKTNLMDEYETLKKERDEEIEREKKMAGKREKGREEYLNQLKQLKAANSEGGNAAIDGTTQQSNQKRGWFGWMRWKRGGDADTADRV